MNGVHSSVRTVLKARRARRGKQSRRVVSAIAGVGALALLATGCGSGSGKTGQGNGDKSGANRAYSIGVVADMSGAAAPEFGATANGFKAAVAKINAAGGVDGHQINIKIYDAQSTATGAVAATESALSSNPLGLFYSVLSNEYQAAYPTLQTATQPVILVGDYDPAYYPKVQANQFTLWTTDPQIVAAWVGKAKELLGGSLEGKKIAYVAPDTAADEAQVDLLKKLAKTDGFTVVPKLTATTVSDFTAGAAQLAQAKPDAVILLELGSALQATSKGLKAAGVTAPLLANEVDAGAAEFATVNSPNYYAFRTSVATEPGDTMTTWANKTGTTSGLSTGFWPDGWSSAYVYAAGLAKCGGSCDAAGLVQALEKVSGVMPPESGIAPYGFSSTNHKGVTGVQFYTLNTSTNKVVASGPIVDISGS